MFKAKYDARVLQAFLALAILIAILDIAGVLDHVHWLKERIPLITLIGVGLVSASALFDEERMSRVLNGAIAENQRRMEETLAVDIAGVAVMSSFRRRWNEREACAKEFLDEVTTVRRRSDLLAKLETYEREVTRGNIGVESRLLFPWDITIMALDSKGKILFHPNRALINTTPNLQHHQEIVRLREGQLLWRNQYLSQALRGLLVDKIRDPEYKVDRFTQVYFKQCRSIDAICVFESHLSVLYQMPAPEKASDIE